jgi:hypothetical protein
VRRRYFQVPVQYEAIGYITVVANNAQNAEDKVRGLMVSMDYEGCDANTDMMPLTPDLTINGEPAEVDDEEMAEPT